MQVNDLQGPVIFICSPGWSDNRNFYSVKWPVYEARDAFGNRILALDTIKWLEIYPFLKDANHSNLRVSAGSISSRKRPKKDRSKERQGRIFRYLMESGKCASKAELARRFGVSRAWVSKVV